MDLHKILNEHHLAFNRFADLIGVGDKTLRKYEYEDGSISERSVEKIEMALDILDNCEIVWPVYHSYKYNFNRDMWMDEVYECNAAFKSLLEAEGYFS